MDIQSPSRIEIVSRILFLMLIPFFPFVCVEFAIQTEKSPIALTAFFDITIAITIFIEFLCFSTCFA